LDPCSSQYALEGLAVDPDDEEEVERLEDLRGHLKVLLTLMPKWRYVIVYLQVILSTDQIYIWQDYTASNAPTATAA
jgi:hypothetical protein